MNAWLVDTLVVTGALIVLVLVVRRPVARLFGPGLAYALWALPLVRLALPPLLLPQVAAAPPPAALDIPLPASVDLAVAPASAAFDWSPLLNLLPWLWLAGALAFLAWRRVTYVRMRERLLCGARPMGEAGRVRIVESPSVTVPVAFGVLDPVVALPPAFLASPDRRARDLALAHEFEHHAGHDLAANMAMQALLALHWFNPIAWIGWRAMRRDQEAACDARVIAGRGGAVRAEYARLIAAFAGGPRLGLAAPMAAPFGLGALLGEKSVIHRLRTLSQPTPSARRQRVGAGLVVAGLLALPATATVSYASIGTPAARPAAPVELPARPPAPAPSAVSAERLALTGDVPRERVAPAAAPATAKPAAAPASLAPPLPQIAPIIRAHAAHPHPRHPWNEAALEARLEAAAELRAHALEAAMEARAEALEAAAEARAEALEAAAEARAEALQAAAEARAEALAAAAEARVQAAQAQRLAREAERLGREADRVAREHAAALRSISANDDECRDGDPHLAPRSVHA